MSGFIIVGIVVWCFYIVSALYVRLGEKPEKR